MKVFEDVVDEVKTFPPGHFFTPEQGFVQYYKVSHILIPAFTFHYPI